MLSISPHLQSFGARYFWKTTSTRSYLQRPEPSVIVGNHFVFWSIFLLLCIATFHSTLWPDTEAQTANGMIWTSVYISIFYYSSHFRNLQIINSEYLLICFPSVIFPFDLSPLFVVQAAAHLITLNRAIVQLWRVLKIPEDPEIKPSEIGWLSSSLPLPQ